MEGLSLRLSTKLKKFLPETPDSSQKYRILVATILLCVGLLIVTCLSLVSGAVQMTPNQLGQALIHQGDSLYQTIVWDIRLPRIIAAILVGSSLGMAGAMLQGMLRNGLADPFLLGISAGAGLVAIIVISLGLLLSWVPLLAWIGSLLTTIFVYLLAKRADGISVERLILGGVAVSSLFGAIQSVLLLLSEDGRIQTALSWLIGSLNGRGWVEVNATGWYICIALVLGCLLARNLNLLSLGDDLAVGLGVNLTRSRMMIGGVAALLSASAVSIAGLIGFVGLIVPHGIRLLVGTDYRALLPLSAVGGALVMTFADFLSRLGAVELPVGAVTALFGSPVFIWLLYQRQSQI
jgi:iron complex transport system permease protein